MKPQHESTPTDTMADPIVAIKADQDKPINCAESATADENEPQSIAWRELRSCGYAVLIMAAIFLISSMESFSSRAPWPIGIGLTVVGLGLVAASFLRRHRQAD